jgi:hypothetical protein
MAARTRFGLEGYGVRRAGSFAGKAAVVWTDPVPKRTLRPAGARTARMAGTRTLRAH